MNKQLLFLVTIFLYSMVSYGQTVGDTFEFDGINYTITSFADPAIVEVGGNFGFSGAATIPTTVSYKSIDYQVTSIATGAFAGRGGLTSVSLPDSVTNIGEGAFSGCESLTSVSFPASVKNIGSYSFQSCKNLLFVSIPDSVTSIGDGAFSRCESLTSVYVDHAIPLTIDASVFRGIDDKATLYVPSDNISAYKEAPLWKNFKIIIEPPAAASHLNFDGSNDYVDCGKGLHEYFKGKSVITIEAMVKPGNKFNTSTATVVKNAARISGEQFHLFMSGDGKSWIFSVGNRGKNIKVTAENSVIQGSWQHVAGVYDGKMIAIYVNGILKGKDQAGIEPPLFDELSQPSLLLGSHDPCGGYHFIGDMDEVRIWGTALSEADINDRKDCELKGDETGLVAYYQFNQGRDQSDNALEASLVDATGKHHGVLKYFELRGAGSNWLTGSPIVTGSACGTLGVYESKEDKQAFKMYPNPSKGILNINAKKSGSFKIMNQLGQVVKTFKVTPNTVNKIDIAFLSNGIYFVKYTQGAISTTKKLVIKK